MAEVADKGTGLLSGDGFLVKSPGQPPQVDPNQIVNAQVRATPNVVGPGGRIMKSGSPDTGDYTVTTTLDPKVQALFEGRNRVAQELIDRAGTNTRLAQPMRERTNAMADATLTPENAFSWDQDASQTVQDAFWGKQKALLDDAFGTQGERLEQRLANQGLPMGGEAYNEEMDRFEQGEKDAYARAAADAVIAGSAEDQRKYQQALGTRGMNLTELTTQAGLERQRHGEALSERDLALREIAAAMGTPISTPGAGYGVVDPSQAYNMANQSAMAAYNADVARNNSLTSGLFGLGGAGIMAISDRRLKRDILRLGELSPGIGWYAFRYSWDAEKDPIRFGVMADEVERVLPDAVVYGEDGFAAVDYARLFSGRTLH